MARRACAVCGAPFDAPPSSKKSTCSRACSTGRKRATHLGVRNTWSDEGRAKLAALGRTPNLELGTPAALLSPVAGPFETNREAKIWWPMDLETGARYRARNLRKFCREHPDLFAPDDWRLAYAGLRQVQAWICGTRKETVSRWKGWTLLRAAAYPEESDGAR